MADFMSRMIEKFRLKEKCVHCQRFFNIYSYFPSYLSADTKPDSILNLPMLLSCGHNACEKCVKVDEKKGKCDNCLDIDVSDEHTWDIPYDMFLIDGYKERIRKTLKESEKKHFSSNCFDGIDKTVEDTKIAIQGGLSAISFKCTSRCSDSVLALYKATIKKINEVMEVQAKNIDGDTMVKKLHLFKSIFEDETSMQETLKSDLSALKHVLPPKVIKERITRFQNFGIEHKIKTILNMVKNGFEVAVGCRVNGVLRWASVSVSESTVYISSFSDSFQPRDSAVRMQYEWLYPNYHRSLPHFVYLEISLNKSFVKCGYVPENTPHKFKIIFKVSGFQRDFRVDKKFFRKKITAFYFANLCLGVGGESLRGKEVIFSENKLLINLICHPIPDKMFDIDGHTSNILKEGFLYAQKFENNEINFEIISKSYKSFYAERIFVARVVSGIYNQINIGKQIDKLTEFDIPTEDGDKVDYYPKITDCGLVLTTKYDYQSETWDDNNDRSSDDRSSDDHSSDDHSSDDHSSDHSSDEN